jgi:AraC family transcriptional regulator
MWIDDEGRRPFVGDPTHVALYNPGQIYRRRPISPEGDRSDWFAVAPDAFREIAADFDPAAAHHPRVGFRNRQAPSDSITYWRQRRVFDYVRTNAEPDVLAVEESVVEILSHILSVSGRRPVAVDGARTQNVALVENARTLLAVRYGRKESLSAMARQLGCSMFHLCRVFRKYTGGTLHEYRHQLRVRHALELVASGSTDLLAVALALGYSSHSHFTAAFRSAFGMSPSALRAATLTTLLESRRRTTVRAHVNHRFRRME